MTTRRSYLPAAGCDWLLWTYDPWVKLLGGGAIRGALLHQMALESGQRVLDVGSGTGSLVVLLKQLHAGISVVGLEPDPAALALAQRKAQRAGVDVHFDRGFSDQLPYADGSFDRVSCTFMFSLLPTAEKETTLREVRRVLRVGCSFHLLDLVKMPPGGFLVRLLRSGQRFQVCTEEQIVALMRRAGGVGVADRISRRALESAAMALVLQGQPSGLTSACSRRRLVESWAAAAEA